MNFQADVDTWEKALASVGGATTEERYRLAAERFPHLRAQYNAAQRQKERGSK
jgi:hypothetical protein